MIHRLIPLESDKEWKKALQGIKHAFGHTWQHCYSQYLTTGHKTFLYSFEKNNRVRMICPIVEREYSGYTDISKPFGFSGFVGNDADNEFANEWKHFVSEKGYVSGYLGLHPVFDYSDLFDSSEVYHYNNVFVLDLRPEIDVILGRMARKRRKQLKKWAENTVQFTENRSELEAFFHENYDNFLHRKKAKSFYFFSPETISYLFSLENIIVVGVKESGRLVAASFFAHTRYIGDALYHLSLPGAEDYSAPLIWYGAIKLKSIGIPALNLGGGFNGIAKFKKRFGTNLLPLMAVKQIYMKNIYDTLCKEIDADPKNLDGYFPAYRKD